MCHFENINKQNIEKYELFCVDNTFTKYLCIGLHLDTSLSHTLCSKTIMHCSLRKKY